MKKIIAILLLLILGFQSLSKLVYVVNYSLNKDFIAKNLCVNRDKPKTKCNGKCHLKKQLDRAEQSESQGKKDSKEKWEDLFFNAKENFLSAPSVSFQNKFFYAENSSPGFSLSIYHPPPAS